MHPSGQPPVSWPNIKRPDGFAWIEVGGTEKRMYDWLEMPAGSVPFKFNGKPPGLYAVGVKTMKGGEIVIRLPSDRALGVGEAPSTAWLWLLGPSLVLGPFLVRGNGSGIRDSEQGQGMDQGQRTKDGRGTKDGPRPKNQDPSSNLRGRTAT